MSAQIHGPNLDSVDTVPLHGVGNHYVDIVGRTWIYLLAAAAINQYDFVKISDDGAFTALQATSTNCPTTLPAKLACRQTSTVVPSGSYFWGFRGNGQFVGNALAATTQDVKLSVSATAGYATSGAVGGTLNGVKVITTVGGANAPAPMAAQGLLDTVYA